jgi:arylsulfatase A-like enzyme
LDQKTLVVFTSDNGPHNEAGHDVKRFQPAGPLKGMKRSLTDGGIRVPCIAWWPGKIDAGRETDHVAYFGDWMATAGELATAKLPTDRDSISFVPTLIGKDSTQQAHEFLYWEFHERGFSQAALYQGRWKGIREQRIESPLVLYDLKNDIGEMTNVAAEHPEIVAKLDAYLKSARSESIDWPIKVKAR